MLRPAALVIDPLDLGDDRVVDEILRVEAAAYTLEARLIGVDAGPGLADSPERLRASGETFVGDRGADGRLLGLLSWVRTPIALDICRLAVDPTATRQGVGRRLVQVALDQPGIEVVTVSTGAANEPALQLYTSAGFVAVGEELVGGPGGGVWITVLERRT